MLCCFLCQNGDGPLQKRIKTEPGRVNNAKAALEALRAGDDEQDAVDDFVLSDDEDDGSKKSKKKGGAKSSKSKSPAGKAKKVKKEKS